MNTKLVYRMGVCSLLGLTFLTACSQASKETSHSSELPNLTNDFKAVSFTQINAKSGTFSIPVLSNWIPSESDSGNDVSVHSAENEFFMTANRYSKADTALSLEEFSHSILKNSPDTKDDEIKLVPTSIADKSGFIFTKQINEKKLVLFFMYEENDEYRLISVATSPDKKAKIQDFLTPAVGGWTSLTAEKYPEFDFSQTIAIPNSTLTATIPASWTQVSEEVPADTTIFQDTNSGIRLSIRGLSTAGYTVDLNSIADEVVPQDSAPSKEEVTIGQYQGYRVQFNQTSENQSNYTFDVYVFHVNDTLITFTASAKASSNPFLQATMETIITSMN